MEGRISPLRPVPPPARESIEALAASLAFPLRKLFVVDGSRRSAHSNAYMVGGCKGGGGGGRRGARVSI